MTWIEAATGATNLPRGLRGPGLALLGYRPFGPGPSRSAFPIRIVRHPSSFRT